MNKHTLRKLGLTALVTVLGATGCAAATDAPAAPVPADGLPVESVPPATMFGPEEMMEKLAMATAEQFGKELFSFLFGDKPFNADDFIHTIDANVRKALNDQILQNGKDVVAYAPMELAEVMSRQKAATTATERQSIATDMESDGRYPALAGLKKAAQSFGAAQTPEVKQAGLSLYVAVTQLLITKLTIQNQLYPDHGYATDLQTWLTFPSTGAISHVTHVTGELREGQVRARMGQVEYCRTYPDDDPMTGFTDHATGEMVFYDYKYHSDTDARCTRAREVYAENIAKAASLAADPGYTFSVTMNDAWASLAHTIDATTPPTTLLAYDFGGMYGTGDAQYPNPFTGALSCPAGYTDQVAFGRYDQDYPFHVCVRPADGVQKPVADFGGMYGVTDYGFGAATLPNGITGDATCPAGFTATKILDEAGHDNPLYFCSRAHVEGGAGWTFGGTFSRRGGYKNPLTEAMICPIGFTSSFVYGSWPDNVRRRNDDVSFCFKAK